jgi:acyl-CoA thioesterase-2
MTNVLELADLPDVLRLQPLGDDRYAVPNVGDANRRDVVFGGQLLAQSIVATASRHPGKNVRSIHAIFARAARVSEPVELVADTMHDGRVYASETVTAWQSERLCARLLVLLDADEPDVIRHTTPMPEVPGPEDSPAGDRDGLLFPGAEHRIVGGVKTRDPDAPVGPAELHVWMRLPGAPDDLGVNQAVLSYGTDGFLIATAMLPHVGIGEHAAHAELSTGVIAHTLTFHEPFLARDWLLMAHTSLYAGHGRSYGEIGVFTEDGTLVASVVQHNMIRYFADPSLVEANRRTIM